MQQDIFQKNKVMSVQEFNSAAKQVIEHSLPLLWVHGEISNFVSAASGHWYFSLKDPQAQVRCVMFRHKSQYLDWRPANGMQVEVLALPTLYEARGEFQLTLEKMRPAGAGALYEAFEKLKLKLEQAGLFDVSRKRPLPYFPRQIGLITSPQAAALRDVLRTLAKRMPSIPVILYPTPVQGSDAPSKIAAAIQAANQRKECDTLIVCRGGGSIEDLWAFNEEIVAHAIAGSQIPVISGVGHETDFTIADFVADHRAATPTAAAQAAVPDAQELTQRLNIIARHLAHASSRRLEQFMQQLDYLHRRLVHPSKRVAQQQQHLQQLQQRLQLARQHGAQQQHWRWQTLQQRLQRARPEVNTLQIHCNTLENRLQELIVHQLERHVLHLSTLQSHLQHLDPKQVFNRGYAMIRDTQGRIVSDTHNVALGDALEITVAKGRLSAEVTGKL
ncbi:MAG: exodeoxyribonuclease VII large subunit [Gallionellaceae bacterium]|jgi:exodeoxyribonuclease VII large subunit